LANEAAAAAVFQLFFNLKIPGKTAVSPDTKNHPAAP